MSRRKKRSTGRKKRRATGSGRTGEWTVRGEIRRVLRREGITAANWKEKVRDALSGSGALQDWLAAYMERNEEKLDRDWAALFLAFWRCVEEKPDRARAIYDHGLSARPPCPLVEGCMGDLFLDYFGSPQRARRHFLAACELAPEAATLHFNLGLVYHLLGVFDRSEREYHLAAQCAREDESEVAARAFFNIGVFHANRADHRAGERFIKRAINLMPDYPEAVEALRQMGKAKGTRRWLGRALGKMKEE